jgi:hypothetical protein
VLFQEGIMNRMFVKKGQRHFPILNHAAFCGEDPFYAAFIALIAISAALESW